MQQQTSKADAGALDLSVVIPTYNEVENIRLLCDEITAALGTLDLSYEVLFVDDGSTDGSFELLAELHAADPRIGAIRFRRNYGQTAAFAAGFDAARGRVVVTMDADRQNDPADVPILLQKLEEGHDVVNGWRQDRQDNALLRKLPSRLANLLIGRTSGVELRDRGCSLRAFRREVTDSLKLYGEMHRFIPELVAANGFSLTEVAVNHRPRTAGDSKYGLSRTFRVLLDLMTVLFLQRYGSRPMHIFGGIGLASGSVGFVIAATLSMQKIWAGIQGGVDAFNSFQIGERPLLLLAVMLMVIGIQFFIMGLLAELSVRTYYESQNKPIYRVRSVLQRTPQDS